MFFVYIIENNNGKLYIGQTYNLEKRILGHNELGKGYTSKFRPWKLVYSEKFDSRKEAMEREKYLKTGVGREWIKDNIKRA
ncbi:MAG TPA: endonuclease [Candidatus Moranbacteria bacterium]|nr:endonuclease [Candidatus Moranbacteria bacterium]HAT74766.1 endonuclease [Candidatus Moranbacteria bacterium]